MAVFASCRSANRDIRVDGHRVALLVPRFADTRNLLNIFEQLGVLGFLAIGMTFVMIAGGIDLSSFTVVSAAAVVGATVMVDTENALLGGMIMLAIAAGLVPSTVLRSPTDE